MRLAIAHEWLVRYAGSERCVEELLGAFPGARLLTTLVDPSRLPPSLRSAEPSVLQRIPNAVRAHEWLLPLMPLAWRLRAPIDDVDVVLSSSHACAKAVRVAPGIPHVCYCHTPMRYAWDFPAESDRFPPPLRPAARIGMTWFRHWDRAMAGRVTRFVANSNAVKQRIERFYGRTADVVFPPVRTDFFTPAGEERDGGFLYVGRLVPYKRPDLVVEAFAGLPYRLTIVGSGQLEPRLRAIASPNVEFVSDVGELELRALYRRARALVYPGEEDFGIVMAEAQAAGTPVIAARRGGALDIVVDGETGWFTIGQSVSELQDAVRRAAREQLDEDVIARSAARFASERFRRQMREIVVGLAAAG